MADQSESVATARLANPPVVDEVPPERALLAARIRELVEASVLVDGTTVDLRAAAARVEAVTESLRVGARDSPLLLAPLAGGGWVSVHNPLEGPGNPLAPPLVWRRIGAESVLAAAGSPGMTASLTVDLHKGTPYGVPLVVEGRLARRDGRKLYATAELRVGDGAAVATATAVLVLFRGVATTEGSE
jgi:hypothetical protein